MQSQDGEGIILKGKLKLDFFFFAFWAIPEAYGGSQARDQIRATAAGHSQPQPRQKRAASATYTTAHGNTGSSTHRVRPGIEPATSQLLV